MADLGARARSASRVLAQLPTSVKDAALLAAAERLVDRTDDVLAANAEGVERAQGSGVSATVIDRLRLDSRRGGGMGGGPRSGATPADPAGGGPCGWGRPARGSRTPG